MDSKKQPRLLLLGGMKISCEIVRAAHKLGMFVGVTDYNKPENSPAKQIADAWYMVSTTDVDAVVDLIKKEDYDGVFVGFVDVLLPYYADICKKAGLPCYGTREQFEMFVDKSKYKQLCREYGVPTIAEYDIELIKDEQRKGEIEYPVIFKPADSSGARGITICYNESQLTEAYDKAIGSSVSKTAILEKYLEGEEATVFWFFENGRYHLSMIGNRHMQPTKPGVIPLPVGYTFPSTLTEAYIRDVKPAAEKMFKSQGIHTGMMFMQCKIVDGTCYMYDIGFRLTGSLEYKILEATCGYNPLELLIQYAVSGKIDDNIRTKVDPYLNGKIGWNISFLMNSGRISTMSDPKALLKIDGVVDAVVAHEVGEEIKPEEIGLLKQICLRVLGASESKDKAISTIREVTNQFTLADGNGESLLLPPLNLSELEVIA